MRYEVNEKNFQSQCASSSANSKQRVNIIQATCVREYPL